MIRRRPWVLWLGLVVLAGCEYPTSTPIIEQRWVFAAESTTIAIDDFLPSGVSVSGSSFDVSLGATSVSQTVADVCAACVALDGFTAPSPGFSSSFASTDSLPDGVIQAVLALGSVDIDIQNGLPFDPIRVGASTGTLVITIESGTGETVGQLSLGGVTDSIPAALTTTRSIALTAGVALTSPLTITTSIVSPAGGSILWDVASSIQVSATPATLLVSSATVDAPALGVSIDSVALDVADVDVSVVDRVQAGAVVLHTTNPFGVGFDATLVISGPTFVDIVKTVALPATETGEVRIQFTQADFQAFLGQAGVVMSGSGTLAGASSVTVSPGQEVGIEADIDLTFQIG